MKAGRLQLIAHPHTGRLRHHRHTSYAGLLFVLLLMGVVLATSSLSATAAKPAVNPQSGSVGLQGVVRGPAPSTSATITRPGGGTHTTNVSIPVSGICTAGTFVQITRNDVFAGATDCAPDGTFSLQIDLFDGANRLVARVSDALGQFGPDSPVVNVFYDAPTLTTPGGAIGQQLFLQATNTVEGVSPGTPLTRSVTIVGGVGPYAVSFDWGDGSSSLVSQAFEGPVQSTHTYDHPGNYRVIVRITDSAGNSGFLQLVTVINGPTTPAGASRGNGTGSIPGSLITAWPLYGLAVLMVAIFWLGELREVRKLRRLQAQANAV